MIYDCFTFFNELDLLEIRLNVLDKVVEKFVLVEAVKTFSNLDKPLYFQQNRKRFEKFEKKIIHVTIDDFPPFKSAWDYEFYQRNAIMRGLKGCLPDDVILISDIDEIPNPKKVLKYKNCSGLIAFEQKMFYYQLNTLDIISPLWTGTRMISFGEMEQKNLGPQIMRNMHGRVVPNGGWHFSYLGSAEKIVEKIKSFSHQEYNIPSYTDISAIEKRMKNGEDLFNRKNKYVAIPIGASFPEYILENKDRFTDLIDAPSMTLPKWFALYKNMWITRAKNMVKNIIRKNS